MKTRIGLLLVAGAFVLSSCADSVTEGPGDSTTYGPANGDAHATNKVVEDPAPVNIPTKPGAEDTNYIKHDTPDQPLYQPSNSN